MRPRRTFWLGVAICLSLMLTLATTTNVAGAVAKLTGGTVTPTTGTAATVFLFSVHFVGTTTDEAISVTASVAGGSLPLTNTGTPRNGTWTGSSTLPLGSWTVVFHSVSTLGTNPSFMVPAPVVVTAPSPTPVPTPIPTAPPPTPQPTVRPTPKPTALPPTATPLPGESVTPGPTPFGTTITNPTNSPGGSGTDSASGEASPSPSASAAGSISSPGRRPFSVPVEGVVAIGLLGAVAVAAALGERRRRQAVAAFRAGQATSDDPYAQAAESDDLGAGSDTVDDETVATIDYDGLDEGPDA